MARKEIMADTSIYKIPAYKVMLVKDGNVPTTNKQIKDPATAAQIIETYFDGLDRENFAILMLNRKNNIIGINTVSVGGLASSLVHPREVFKPAIIMGAAALILAHNHPSGDTIPSAEDKNITRRLVECGKLLGIEILDHIIMGDNSFCSLKSEGDI